MKPSLKFPLWKGCDINASLEHTNGQVPVFFSGTSSCSVHRRGQLVEGLVIRLTLEDNVLECLGGRLFAGTIRFAH